MHPYRLTALIAVISADDSETDDVVLLCVYNVAVIEMDCCVLCECTFDKRVSGSGYNRRLLSCKLRRSSLTVFEVLKTKFNNKVCCVHSSVDSGIDMWAL